MFRLLVLLFIVVPAIELWGLIAVGKWIGGWTTVGLVILSGVLGAWLAKQQGLQVLRLVQLQLSRGQLPTDALLDGLLVLAGGMLLLTPGFFTDIAGLVLLIPYTRMFVRFFLKKWIVSLIASGRITMIFRR
ncbi:membrane protein FxsA [Brevibacillus sp. SYP-B805]|uniref:FxsA family protein n=1 Tax=Brevibacillus sp. SYP-B805 TaxID=1578199 RepID=UPI0013EA7AAE|nr:FxsA family protein [Brevibacillus sp. SYP-B805]NGQ94845.1 membrane protein FxsA [Brevibacillus sp. SYP-B805]